MGIFVRFSSPTLPCFLRFFIVSFLVFLAVPQFLCAQWNALNPVQSSQKDASALTLNLERGAVRFQICSDTIIRVLYSPQHEFPHVKEYVVTRTDWRPTPFDVNETADNLTLTTAKLKIVVAKKDSSIIFYDASGQKLAAENDRTM